MIKPEHLQPLDPAQTVVLVAEDEDIVQNIVRLTLEADGYFVLTAHYGLAALQLSRKFPAEIHLLLTDVRMPQMDGIELCHHILEERPNCKVLIMSGTHRPGMEAAYLPKPFTLAMLRESIGELIPKPVLVRRV